MVWHVIWYGMALRTWYGIWFGLASMLWYMVYGELRMLYGMAWRTRMVNRMDWQVLHCKHHMVMSCQAARHGAWHSIWYVLVYMVWCMVWPGGQGMVYGMAWLARHDIWYGLAVMAWYMVWPGGVCYSMLKDIVKRHVSWRSCSHVPDPFTSKGPFTCMFRSHVQSLFTLGRDSR